MAMRKVSGVSINLIDIDDRCIEGWLRLSRWRRWHHTAAGTTAAQANAIAGGPASVFVLGCFEVSNNGVGRRSVLIDELNTAWACVVGAIIAAQI